MSTEEPMSIEDRVRTATRAGATLVRDIGPLPAEPEQARFRRRSAPASPRWGSWGIPLAAAAAVVLVALSLVAVRQFGATAPATGGPDTTAPATVPRYYVAPADEHGYDNFGALLIGDDVTGQTLATVSAPPGLDFVGVQGASDDRAFVVMAVRKALVNPLPATWYLLRITPGAAHPYQLTKLPIRLPSSSSVGVAYALSPDDRDLAIESMGAASSDGARTTLGVYSVPSGAKLRAWTSGKAMPMGPVKETLSWLPGGRQLAFSVVPPGGSPGNQLRTLDLTASGTDLMAASRALLTVKSPGTSPSSCYTMYLTPDGGTAICATQYAFIVGPPGTSAGCANGGLEFTAYSVRTGQPIRDLYQYRGACHSGLADVLWTGSSATSIVGAIEIDETSQGEIQNGELGVITDGRIRLLNLPTSVSRTFYALVAF